MMDNQKKTCPVCGSTDIGPYNEGLASEILAFDVLPNGYLGDFTKILDRPKTSLGYPENPVTKEVVNKLHLLGIKEI